MVRTRNAVTVAVAALLVLSGCGRSVDNGGGEAVAEPVGAGPATGTINMWAQGAEAEALPALLDTFEAANPGVEVNLTAIPWDAAHNKYQAAIAGGTTPDLAQLGTTWMADFAAALEPTPGAVDTSDMFAGSLAPTVVEGTSVGVPWYVDTRVIYYRTDLAAAAGYTAPPTTWEDFKAMARAMQTEAGAQWGIALQPGGTDSFQSNVLPFVWSNGASLMNDDRTSWTFDTPQMAEALTYYQSFFTEGIADVNLSKAPGVTESAFVSGATPMFLGPPSAIGQLEQAGGAGFSERYAVMQFPKKESATSFIGGSDLVVFKDAQNRDGAWKLVQWLSQPDTQATFYKSTGNLPSVQSAWDDPSFSKDARLAVFRSQLTDTNAPPANTTWTRVSAAADEQLERIVKSGDDPVAAVAALQDAADTIGTGG